MNLTMFFGIQFWYYLVAAASVLTSISGKGDDDFSAFDQQLKNRWKTILGSSWWSATKNYFAGDRKENEKTVVVPSTSGKRLRSSRLLDGLFVAKNDYRGRERNKNKTTRRLRVHVTADRVKDASADVNGIRSATSAASPPAEWTVFDTENECVSTNNGRPCVCYTTDFLDKIDERWLDETAVHNRMATPAFRWCRSYKPVPASFSVSPTAANAAVPSITTVAAVNVSEEEDSASDGGNGTVAAVPARTEVDFDYVVNYRRKTSTDNDDHFTVHYGLVGSDVEVRCLVDGNGNNAETNASLFNWQYKEDKHKSNSTITGTDTNKLLIIGLEPSDSKNYTCLPNTNTVNKSKNDRPYTHYVIAVEKPNYEIYSTAFYKTTDNNNCTIEIINNVRKQMPSAIRSVMCPEGSSQYACNVEVVTSKCVENEVGTLEIEYLVTLNEKASCLIRIRVDKKSRDVLYYQRQLAGISNVMVQNLNNTLKVQIKSEMSSATTTFEPDYGRMQIKKYVFCSRGFGIREVFCVACPPHHYSPDKTTECLKCPKGFHQPVAGSEECVKCPTPFSSGCYMREGPYIIYFVLVFICLLVSFFLVDFCFCYFKEIKKTDCLIPMVIKKEFKRPKEYIQCNFLEDEQWYTSDLGQKIRTIQKCIKVKQKSKQNLVKSKMTFRELHEKLGQDLRNDQIPK